MACKYKHESKISNVTGISLLNVGEGFVAVRNDDGRTIPNESGIIITETPFHYKNKVKVNDNDDELSMLRLFYLGGISITGLYLFYRIMSKK